ncbi:xylose ABC transporter membrane protein [Hypnocyclicus thermotrophus]|uniref:Xylose transport system permease protein XylH n=1 Tax=Hypnocyclicus thermotrophus TaxID=1627895 RepID=A0AA46DX78_9FUSO|nr:inner-membrane translocator [Hypnocyclicus thermotrophus]TDT67904.1 xylose ABC transporter membrane protein [Hypnocyclicus thermotrophus]
MNKIVSSKRKKSKKIILEKFLKKNMNWIILLIMVLFLSLVTDSFLTARNLSNLIRQSTIVGIIAVGMTGVILLGGVDLSVGSIVGLAAVTVTLLMEKGLNEWISIILTLIFVGGLIGYWNGYWISRYKMEPFIVTLGMMTIARGLALTISKNSSIPVKNENFTKIAGSYISIKWSIILLSICLLYILIEVTYYAIKKREVLKNKSYIKNTLLKIFGILLLFLIFIMYKGIPNPVAIFSVIIIISIFILNNTKFGRDIYAAGGNREAARLSGIDIDKVHMKVFIITSVLAAFSGIILASRLNGASPSLGNMMELDAITAVAIGGTSLSGGIGGTFGTLLGIFIISILNNGMSLLGLPESYQLIIKGLIITMAVWGDIVSKNKKYHK